jgi:signal transduction protein with GAF and PtsI domain
MNQKSLTERLLQQKEQEIDLLQQIIQTIGSSSSLQEILDRICEIVVKVTGADAGFVYLLVNEEEQALVLRASKNPHHRLLGHLKLKLGEGITGWVAKERRPVAIAQNASSDSRFKFFHNLPEDKYEAFLSVPILSQSQVIGVINVQHRQLHQHTQVEVDLLATAARLVGGAIEKTRLYEETQKKAQQIETLSRISKTVVSRRYLEEILNLIVTMTAEMMNSKICSIMLLDEEKNELAIKASQSLSEAYLKKPNLKVGESVSGRVVKEKRPITVLDVTKEEDYSYPEIARQEGLCSLLSVPMVIKDKVIGVINSYTDHQHQFSPEEIKILSTVANQAAVAIENTKLMSEKVAMQEALETRKVVERAKGVLMKEHKIFEPEAFKLIQRQSMNTRKSMREIAEAIILASEINQGRRVL